MGSLYLWGRSIQEMGGNVVIGRSIYGVVVIDGSLYSRFYGTLDNNPFVLTAVSSNVQDLTIPYYYTESFSPAVVAVNKSFTSCD